MLNGKRLITFLTIIVDNLKQVDDYRCIGDW